MYWVTLLIILIHVGPCHRNIHCIRTSSGWYVSWDNRFACTCSVDLFILQNHVMSVWPHLIWWDDFKNFQCKVNGRHIHRIVWNERRDSVRACMLCQELVSRAGTSKYTPQTLWGYTPQTLWGAIASPTLGTCFASGKTLLNPYAYYLGPDRWHLNIKLRLHRQSERALNIVPTLNVWRHNFRKKMKDDNNKYHIPVENHYHCFFCLF